jgi:hypothetical protein
MKKELTTHLGVVTLLTGVFLPLLLENARAEKVVVIPLFRSNCDSIDQFISPLRTGQERCTAPHVGVSWKWTLDCVDADPSGQDGELQAGTKWPVPRFTDNGDGTVSDNLTGLVWLQDADCLQGTDNWYDALTFAGTLYDGWTEDPDGGDCGLSDGSAQGDWRIPTIRELLSIIHYDYYQPALSNASGTAQWSEDAPFSNVDSEKYWTSSSYADGASSAWYVHLKSGDDGVSSKAVPLYVWPVRSRL